MDNAHAIYKYWPWAYTHCHTLGRCLRWILSHVFNIQRHLFLKHSLFPLSRLKCECRQMFISYLSWLCTCMLLFSDWCFSFQFFLLHIYKAMSVEQPRICTRIQSNWHDLLKFDTMTFTCKKTLCLLHHYYVANGKVSILIIPMYIKNGCYTNKLYACSI